MARTNVDGLGCTVIALDVITASGCEKAQVEVTWPVNDCKADECQVLFGQMQRVRTLWTEASIVSYHIPRNSVYLSRGPAHWFLLLFNHFGEYHRFWGHIGIHRIYSYMALGNTLDSGAI